MQAATPALHVGDDDPAGFAWLAADDADHSVLAFERRVPGGGPADAVVVVANLTPVPRHGYRVGLDGPGRWYDLVNTDDERWGGSGVGHHDVEAEPLRWQGRDHSAVLTLPPLAVRWLRRA